MDSGAFLLPEFGIRAIQGHSRDDVGLYVVTAAQERLSYESTGRLAYMGPPSKLGKTLSGGQHALWQDSPRGCDERFITQSVFQGRP